MAKRIRSSEKDRATLNKLLTNRQIVESSQPRDYRNRVVVKPWGYEFLIFENECVAAWFLHIRKGHSTSMHCHPTKKTSLILLSGKALCNTFEHRNYLNNIEAVIIEPGVFHSTQSLSAEGINLIEVETPPNKTDLVRLNDEYGREAQGYEGHSEMQTEGLERFGFFYFNADIGNTINSHTTSKFMVALEFVADGDGDLAQRLIAEKNAYYCVCKGRLLGTDGNVVLDTGDAEAGDVLCRNGFDKQPVSEQTVLLMARGL